MFICDLGPSPKVTTPVCMHVHMHARVCVYAWAPDLALRHIICRYTMAMYACMYACMYVCMRTSVVGGGTPRACFVAHGKVQVAITCKGGRG